MCVVQEEINIIRSQFKGPFTFADSPVLSYKQVIYLGVLPAEI